VDRSALCFAKQQLALSPIRCVVAVDRRPWCLSLLRGDPPDDLAATRYALTNHRRLVFQLTRDGTRAKSFPPRAEPKSPICRLTSRPPFSYPHFEQADNPPASLYSRV